jgi:hypothetical protein
MDKTIEWLTDPELAISKAKDKNMPIFLDFFNPQ